MRPAATSNSSGPTIWYSVALPASSSTRDDGAEEDATRLRGVGPHDLELVEALGQELDAPVDLAQPLLAVDVLGVLGAIALGRGRGDLARDARPLDAQQPHQLLLEDAEAARR